MLDMGSVLETGREDVEVTFYLATRRIMQTMSKLILRPVRKPVSLFVNETTINVAGVINPQNGHTPRTSQSYFIPTNRIVIPRD